MSRLALLGLALSASIVPALADTALDGWGPYKFGMTPDQVRAIPGATWNDLKKIPMAGAGATLDSKKPITALDGKYAAQFTFDAANHLTMIDLGRSMEIQQPACNAQAGKLTAAAEQVYGPFQPDQTLVKSTTPGITYQAVGKSRFLVQSSDTQDIGKVVIAVARHTQGKAAVALAINYADPPYTDSQAQGAHVCTLHVSFTPK
jgi:hypothetical protein